jgi:hypothetical protein
MSFFQITWFSSAPAEKRSPFPAEIHTLANDCDQLRRRSLTGMLTSEAHGEWEDVGKTTGKW